MSMDSMHGIENAEMKNQMSEEEMEREIIYKISVRLLNILKNRGLISEKQYTQIDMLNLESFSPKLKSIYI